MIIKLLKLVFSTLLISLISIEFSSANQQEEKLIQQNKEAAKSSTNQAMFVVHRIKCLNSNDRAALNACNKALSINPNAAALRNRKVLLSNRLNPKPKKQPVRKVTKVPARPVKQVVRKTPAPIKAQITKKPYSPSTKTVVKTKPSPNVKNDNKKIIIQIQKSLNQLGFDVGRADGVAGKNTKQAIKDFQRLSKSKIRLNLDNKLQLALQKALKQHAVADNKYHLAKQQLNDGNLEESSQLITKYLKIAPWHQNLNALNKELKQKIAQKEDDEKSIQFSEKLAKAKSTKDLAVKSQLETQANIKRKETMALIELSQTQFDNKEIENAISTTNKGLELSPDNKDLLSLKNNIQTYKEKQIKIDQIVSESQQMYKNEKLNNSMALIEEGLALNPNQADLLALKSKVLQKQEEIQAQKEKEETLSILYARALKGFNNNELDSAIAFAEKGLSLESTNPKLLELKSKIIIKQDEIKVQKDRENILTNLYNQSLASFNNNELNAAIVMIDEGLSLESSHTKLLELKTQVIAKQDEMQIQNRKNEQLANLYSQASDSLRNNQIESAMAFVNEGLVLDSKKLNLLELKRDIILKKNESIALEKTNQKIAMMLNLIEEKQSLIKTIDNKMLDEQQFLLNQAQQTLESSLSQ